LLLLWYFFITERKVAFAITLVLALATREDAGITIAGMGVIMLLFRKENRYAFKYGIITIVSSVIWTVSALTIIKLFAITGSYKFFAFYGWMGEAPLEVAHTIFFSPLTILSHIITLDTLALLFLLFLPILYLILLAPVFLISLAFPILVMILTERGSTPLIAFLHYSAWFMPSIYLGAVYGVKKIVLNKNGKFISALYKGQKYILLSFSIAIIYFFITLHPAVYIIYKTFTNHGELLQSRATKQILLSHISDSASVITSGDFFTELSSRESVNYLRFLYSNRYQLSNKPYDFTPSEYILFRPTDLVYYELLTRKDIYQSQIRGEALDIFIQKNNYTPLVILNDYILMKSDAKEPYIYYDEIESLPKNLVTPYDSQQNDTLSLLGWEKISITKNQTIATFYFQKNKSFDEALYLKFKIYNNDLMLEEIIAPPSFGLVTTDRWPLDTIIKSKILLNVSHFLLTDITKIEVIPITLTAVNTLNRFSGAELVIESIIEHGPAVTIPL